MPVRRYLPTGTSGVTTIPGARIGSALTADGNRNAIFIKDTTGDTTLGSINDPYTGGDGTGGRFILADFIVNQGRLKFSSYGREPVIYGWPRLDDIDVDATPPTFAGADGSRTMTIPDNWEIDPDTGLVMPARRFSVTLNGDPMRNASGSNRNHSLVYSDTIAVSLTTNGSVAATGTPAIPYDGATFNGNAVSTTNELDLRIGDVITIGTQTLTLTQNHASTSVSGTIPADSYTRTNPALIPDNEVLNATVNPGPIIFIGADFHYNYTGAGNFNVGSTTATNDTSGTPSTTDIAFINCRLLVNHSDTGFLTLINGRNLFIEGLEVTSNTTSSLGAEFQAANGVPTTLNNFALNASNLLNNGNENPAAVASTNNNREIGFPYRGTSTDPVIRRVFTGLSGNNIWFWSGTARSRQNAGANRPAIVMLNPIQNIVKTADNLSFLSSNNTATSTYGDLSCFRTVSANLSLSGSTTAPSMLITRRNSGQVFGRFASNVQRFYNAGGGAADGDNQELDPVAIAGFIDSADDIRADQVQEVTPNAIAADGAWTQNLLQYFNKRENTFGRAEGDIGPITIMMNQYRIPIYSYGFVTQFLGGEETYHVGGAVPDVVHNGSFADTYFGLNDIPGRDQYSINGVDFGDIELAVDGNVTESNQATVVGRSRIANWQQFYDAFHYQSTVRTDNDNLNRGNQIVSVTNQLLDMGNVNLTFADSDKGSDDTDTGTVAGVSGVSGTITVHTDYTNWADGTTPTGVTDDGVLTIGTGTATFTNFAVASVECDTITINTPRTGTTAAAALVPSGVQLTGAIALPAASGTVSYYIDGDCSNCDFTRASGTGTVRLILGTNATDIASGRLGANVEAIRTVSIPTDVAGKFVIWSTTRDQILHYATTTLSGSNHRIEFDTSIFNSDTEMARIFFKGNDTITGTTVTYYEPTRSAEFTGRSTATYPAAVNGRILSPLLAPPAGSAFPTRPSDSNLISLAVTNKTASTAYNANTTSTDDTLNPNVVHATLTYTPFDGNLTFSAASTTDLPASGTVDIDLTSITYDGEAVSGTNTVQLAVGTIINLNNGGDLRITNEVEFSTATDTLGATNYERVNPTAVTTNLTLSATITDTRYPAVSGSGGFNAALTRFMFGRIQDDPSYLITWTRRVQELDPADDDTIIPIIFDSRNVELDGRAITVTIGTGLDQFTLASVSQSTRNGSTAAFFSTISNLTATAFAFTPSPQGATAFEVIRAAQQAAETVVPQAVATEVRPIVQEELNDGIFTSIGRTN